jgi:hypothetical protein
MTAIERKRHPPGGQPSRVKSPFVTVINAAAEHAVAVDSNQHNNIGVHVLKLNATCTLPDPGTQIHNFISQQ